jgi:hypothetical protein
MSVLTLPALVTLQQAIDRMQKSLTEVDPLAISAKQELKDKAAQVKAWVYVWLAAGLEEYLKKLSGYVLDEISGQAIQCSQLRLSLFAVFSGNHFDGVKSGKGLPMWHKRIDVLDPINDAAVVTFNTNFMKLDGKTIRAQHFKLIWRVFGFDGTHLPAPAVNYEAALETLADGRNDVAHGHEDPIAFGRKKTIADVRGMLKQVEDVIDHISLAADDYINNAAYLR